MKIMIAFPPLLTTKGYPTLTQNRQFQWFSSPSTFIYPIIPSSAATLLKMNDFDVNFYDGITLKDSYKNFLRLFQRLKPDVVAIETKTPIIKQHWKIINELKTFSKDTNFVLMGDHVTAMPKESLENCEVDFVITGGDFDVSLLNLAKHLRDNSTLPKGVWYRENKNIKNTGNFEVLKNLDELPLIDRELTHWELYGEAYLFRPVAYTMAGRDCPMKCSFCSWSWNLFPGMRYRSVNNVLNEIEFLIEKYKIKEIFDDTGTFTINKKWVENFCKGMIERGINEKISFSTNARFDTLLDKGFCKLLKNAGFRLLKVGLESGNDATLKKINKGETIETIEHGYKNAKDVGLIMMLTIMVGYPWERKIDALRTIKFAKKLLKYKTDLGDSLQASVVTPYPGTLLFKQSIKNGWFRINSKDWEKYDMTEPVLKSSIPPKEVMNMCDSLWKIYLSPTYVLKTMLSIKSFNEVGLLFRGVKSVIGHIKDYSM